METIEQLKQQIEEIQRKIDVLSSQPDWSKIPKGVPIYVSSNGKNWVKRYFHHYENERVYAVYNGCTIWSTELDCIEWGYAVPAPDAPSIINWRLWNGGENPVPGKEVLIKVTSGRMSFGTSEEFCWGKNIFPTDVITMYAVIE